MTRFFLLIISSILYTIFLPNPVSAAIETRQLMKGWNLVSIPVADPISCDSYLDSQGITSHVVKIWNYNNGWTKYEPGSANSTFTDFQPNHGYWFKLSHNTQIAYDTTKFGVKALQITKPGWVLASLNQNESLSIENQVINSMSIDQNHNTSNLDKIWEYNDAWSKYQENGSGTLISLKPTFAYWFKFKSTENIINEQNPLIISPNDELSAPVSFIGGSTSLIPPNESQVQAVDSLKFRSSRISNTPNPILYDIKQANYTFNTQKISCDSNEDINKIVGYAFAYDLSGRLLNKSIPAPLLCPPTANNSLSYTIQLSKLEKIEFYDSAEDARQVVVKLQLNSGQCQKGYFVKPNIDEPSSSNLNLDSISTLSVVAMSKQIAQQLKVNPNQLNLGEEYAGFNNLNSKLYDINKPSEQNYMDLDTLNSKITVLSNDINSPFFALQETISHVNQPQNLIQNNRSFSKSKEFINLIAGKSIDNSNTDFLKNLSLSSKIIEHGSQLLSKKVRAKSNSLIIQDSSEDLLLESVLSKVFESTNENNDIFKLSNILKNTLEIANVSSNHNNLKEKSFSNLSTVLHKVSNISLDSNVPNTSIINLVNIALDYPKDSISEISNNDELSGELANMYSQGLITLDKARYEDKNQASFENRSLNSHLDVVSKLTQNKSLIQNLISQTTNLNTISKVLAGIVQNVSNSSTANQILIDTFKEISNHSDVTSDIKIDYSQVMKIANTVNDNRSIIAKTLAKNIYNSSEVYSMLDTAKESLDSFHFNELLIDSELVAKFQHNQKLYADAGPDIYLRNNFNENQIILNAQGSFDPLDSQLMYEWFMVIGNTELPLDEFGPSISKQVITTTFNSINNNQSYIYRVKVFDTNNIERFDYDDVKIHVTKKNSPKIVVPNYLSHFIEESSPDNKLIIDASSSYCSNSCTNLSFQWQLYNTNMTASSLNNSSIELDFSSPGVYKVNLTLNHQGSSVSKDISILVKKRQRLIADIGNDLSIPQRKIIESNGYLLSNKSKSSTSSALSYEWSPRFLFSSIEGFDYKSKEPLFIATNPKRYSIQLTVNDQNNLISKDKATITVIKVPQPHVFAGTSKTIFLDEPFFIIDLNGSNSFSYNTDRPNYRWEGPTEISNSTSSTTTTIVYANRFFEPTTLTYTLYVSDDLGTSSDQVEFLVIPKSNSPIVIVDQYPKQVSYYKDQTISFDASKSFSSSSYINEFNWRTEDGLHTSSQKEFDINLSNFEKSFKVYLTVTDSNGEIAERQFDIPIAITRNILKPTTEPSNVYTKQQSREVIEFSCDNNSAETVDNISYDWVYNDQYIDFLSSNTTKSKISISVSTDITTNIIPLSCVIKDEHGTIAYSDSSIHVIHTSTSPVIDFDMYKSSVEGSLIEAAQFNTHTNSYVFSNEDNITASGKLYFENSVSENLNLIPQLFHWNQTSQVPVSKVTNTTITQQNNIVNGVNSFQINIQRNLSTNTYYQLRLLNDDSTINSSAIFKIRTDNYDQEPTSLLQISSIESDSIGFQKPKTSHFSFNYLDSNITLNLDGSKSTSPYGNQLQYRWSYEWINNDNIPLFIEKSNTAYPKINLPLSFDSRPLKVSLVVKDIESGLVGETLSVTVDLQKRPFVRPIAKIKDIPVQYLEFKQATKVVTLDATESFSPNSRILQYMWKYIGPTRDVSKNSDGIYQLTLPEGEHIFELQVNDTTNFTSLPIYKKVVVAHPPITTNNSFLVKTSMESLPITLNTSEPIVHYGKVEVLNDNTPIDHNLILSKVTLFDQNNDVYLNYITTGTSVENQVYLNKKGIYNYHIYTWYDSNQDGQHTVLDNSQSSIYTKSLVASNKIEDISISLTSFENNSLNSQTSKIQLSIHNPNKLRNWNHKFISYLIDLDKQTIFRHKHYLNVYNDSVLLQYPKIPTGRYKLIAHMISSDNEVNLVTNFDENIEVLNDNVPLNLTVRQENYITTANWDLVPNSSSYTLYYHLPNSFQMYSITTDTNFLSANLFGLHGDQLFYVSSTIQEKESALSKPIFVSHTPQSHHQTFIKIDNKKAIITWDNIHTYDSFNFYYSSSKTLPSTNWVKVHTRTPKVTLFNLQPDTEYFFSIQDMNKTQEGLLSQTLSFSTSTPTVPLNLKANSINGKMKISWDPINSYNAYTLHYSTDPNLENKFTKFVDAGSDHYKLENLPIDQTYYFSISARGFSGSSMQSNIVSAVSKSSLPSNLNYSKLEVKILDNIIYIFDRQSRLIHRQSINSPYALEPIHLKQGVIQFTASPVTNQLYVAYQDGSIFSIEPKSITSSTLVTHIHNEPKQLLVNDQYLLVSTYGSQGSSYKNIYLYDLETKNEILQLENINTNSFFSSDTSTSIYYANYNHVYKSNISTEEIIFESVTPKTHFISSEVVAFDNNRVLLDYGIFYNLKKPNKQKLFRSADDLIHTEFGTYTIENTSSRSTTLRKYDSNLNSLYSKVFLGDPLLIKRKFDQVFILTKVENQIQIYTSPINNDYDKDGVLDENDSFPLDPSASQDTDFDGFPDQWNNGYTSVDSFSGLLLDDYPNDSSCQQLSQKDEGTCTYQRKPTQILSGINFKFDAENVYIHSVADNSIYRWSISNNTYLTPIPIKENSKHFLYDPNNHKLLVFYDNFTVTRIDLDDNYSVESKLFNLPEKVQGTCLFDDVLYIDGFYTQSYTFTTDGTPITVPNPSYYYQADRTTYCSKQSNKVFHFDKRNRKFSIHSIDLADGTILPNQVNYTFNDTNFWSVNNATSTTNNLVLSNGQVYDVTTFKRLSDFPSNFVQMEWYLDYAVTIERDQSNTILKVFNKDFTINHSQTLTGRPIKLEINNSKILVVSEHNSTLLYHFHNLTEDIDLDGFSYLEDKFPNDIAASVDQDNDGSPDYWNNGFSSTDSTTSLTIDAFPLDMECQHEVHRVDGICDIKRKIPKYTPDQSFEADSIVYLLSKINSKIYRWSATTKQDLEPINIQANCLNIIYSLKNNTIYLAYENESINKIELDNSIAEQPFLVNQAKLISIHSVGNYLLTISGSYPVFYSIFNVDGQQLSTQYVNYGTSGNTWDPISSRVFFYNRPNSLGTIDSFYIDQQTGLISNKIASQYQPSSTGTAHISISTQSPTLFDKSGNIYNTQSLKLLRKLNVNAHTSQWSNGDLFTQSKHETNMTKVMQWDNGISQHQEYVISGTPIGLYLDEGLLINVSLINDKPSFTTFKQIYDHDLDGVDNKLDSFPYDKSASKDSDGDSWPDYFNNGYSSVDPEVILTIDGFPYDELCFKLDHGTDGVCDYSKVIPPYIPRDITSDRSINYLLDTSNSMIYRWSAAKSKYLTPIKIKADANNLAYDVNQDSLLVSYTNNELTSISLSNPISETHIYQSPHDIFKVFAIEDIICIITIDYGYNRIVTMDRQGTILYSANIATRLIDVYWNKRDKKLYHIHDKLNYNNLDFHNIDTTTGRISTISSNRRLDAVITAPIVISPDNSKMLIGNGDIYDTNDFNFVAYLDKTYNDAKGYDSIKEQYTRKFDTSFTSAAWSTNAIMTISPKNSNSTVLTQWTTTLSKYDNKTLNGQAVKVIANGNQFTIITLVNGYPTFYSHTVTEDTDQDGFNDDVDAFILDSSASRDTDKDHSPDNFNDGYTSLDSTQGLQVDIFPFDPYCQLLEHDLNGECNPTRKVPVYHPDKIELVGNTIYLFSSANEQIFRWDLNEDKHLNPIQLSASPQLFTYSKQLDQFYISYKSGTITTISTANSFVESNFIDFGKDVSALTAINEFVFVANKRDYYIYDSSNQLKSHTISYNNNAHGYLFDKPSSKLYYVSKTYPYNLQYSDYVNSIQTLSNTQSFTNLSNHQIDIPLNTSSSGKFVILKSGVIYDSTTFKQLYSFEKDITDAVWIGDELITIRVNENNTLIEHWDEQFKIYNQQTNVGKPIRILHYEDQTVIVSTLEGMPIFSSYKLNNDKDKDGVANHIDAFPDDIAASIDSDNDGWPDQWNVGYDHTDSITNLTIDFFPQDSACQKLHQGPNGFCDIEQVIGEYLPEKQVIVNDIVYLLNKNTTYLNRWSTTNESYLNPIILQDKPTSITYSNISSHLYISYNSGLVNKIDLNGNLKETEFIKLDEKIIHLFSDSRGLLVAGKNNIFVYNLSGNQLYKVGYYSSYDYQIWNENNQSLFGIYDNSYSHNRPNRLIRTSIDFVNNESETLQTDDSNFSTTIALSPLKNQLLVSSGSIFNTTNLRVEDRFDEPHSEALWLNEEIVTLTETNDNTKLQQWDMNFKLYNEVNIPGTPIDILKHKNYLVIVTLNNNKPYFTNYFIDNDADDDNIPSSIDAFPLDPSASIDSDSDGWPDQWNLGHTSQSSSQSLTIDAFPNDYECQTLSHGAQGLCDISNDITKYLPQSIAYDTDTIYMLNQVDQKVYRWSYASQNFLKALPISRNAKTLSYSNGRLYIGYENQKIEYISTETLVKHSFIDLDGYIFSIHPTENYVLVEYGIEYDKKMALFDLDGKLTDTRESYRIQTYNYNKQDSTFYTLDDNSRLSYRIDINQNTSLLEFGSQGSLPTGHSGDPTVIFSDIGHSMLFGNGIIYDIITNESIREYKFNASLGEPFVDAAWIHDEIVTLQEHKSSNSILVHYSGNKKVYNKQLIQGSPLKVVRHNSELIVVTYFEGRPLISIYSPNQDGDNDGVHYNNDRFPLDPAISRDTDNDGFPDDWNEGYSSSALTPTVTLDAYPNDSACTIEDEGYNNVCYISDQIENYSANAVSFDGTIVYLLSIHDQRVYRWHSIDREYLNPIVIGENASLMSLSKSMNRLYIGYLGGHVHKIELQNFAREEPFTILAKRIENLFNVSNRLFIQEYYDKHIFDENGLLLDSHDAWSGKGHVWDSENELLLFLRFGQSSIIYSEQINLETGKLNNHSDFYYKNSLTGPIKLSKDGKQLFFKGGQILNKSNFTLKEKLPNSYVDGVWHNKGLLTIRTGSYNTTILEQRDNNFDLIISKEVQGKPYKIVGEQNNFIVITSNNYKISFTNYSWNDDVDNDGVSNELDDFPYDVSASKDSDNDGNPDTWNEGFTSSAKTPEMTMDYYPSDSACTYVDQGSNGVCDITRAIPNYTPSQVISDGSIIYLLSTDKGKLFRWSVASESDLNPIILDGQALKVTYSSHTGKLYMAYSSGHISQVSTSTGYKESKFAKIDKQPSILKSIGKFILTADPPASYNYQYVLNEYGKLVHSSRDYRFFAEWYTINQTSSTIYYLAENYTKIKSKSIDPSTGNFGNLRESATSNSQELSSPIIVSPDNQSLILGSGNIYSPSNLTVREQLPIKINDAMWIGNSLYTITKTIDENCELKVWSNTFSLTNTVTFDGSPIKIIHANDKLIIITSVNGKPVFNDLLIQ